MIVCCRALHERNHETLVRVEYRHRPANDENHEIVPEAADDEPPIPAEGEPAIDMNTVPKSVDNAVN